MRMAEWFKVAVLKAVVRCTVGSNPTPLSYKIIYFLTYKLTLIYKMKLSVFLLSPKKKKKVIKNEKKTVKKVSLFKNYGFIETVGAGIAQVKGLFNVKAGELVRIYPFNILALALNLGEKRVGLVLCGSERFVNQNDIVSITGKLISIPINPKILGTVIDPLGFNLMTNQTLSGSGTVIVPVEQGAPDIISRQPIFEPMLTGLTVIDSLVPIGRGQRELIIGDRQTGKPQ